MLGPHVNFRRLKRDRICVSRWLLLVILLTLAIYPWVTVVLTDALSHDGHIFWTSWSAPLVGGFLIQFTLTLSITMCTRGIHAKVAYNFIRHSCCFLCRKRSLIQDNTPEKNALHSAPLYIRLLAMFVRTRTRRRWTRYAFHVVVISTTYLVSSLLLSYETSFGSGRAWWITHHAFWVGISSIVLITEFHMRLWATRPWILHRIRFPSPKFLATLHRRWVLPFMPSYRAQLIEITERECRLSRAIATSVVSMLVPLPREMSLSLSEALDIQSDEDNDQAQLLAAAPVGPLIPHPHSRKAWWQTQRDFAAWLYIPLFGSLYFLAIAAPWLFEHHYHACAMATTIAISMFWFPGFYMIALLTLPPFVHVPSHFTLFFTQLIPPWLMYRYRPKHPLSVFVDNVLERAPWHVRCCAYFVRSKSWRKYWRRIIPTAMFALLGCIYSLMAFIIETKEVMLGSVETCRGAECIVSAVLAPIFFYLSSAYYVSVGTFVWAWIAPSSLFHAMRMHYQSYVTPRTLQSREQYYVRDALDKVMPNYDESVYMNVVAFLGYDGVYAIGSH